MSTQVHRALAEPTRATLFEILRVCNRPCDVLELADGLGVHANTVRSHLQVLEEAGLVVSMLERRHRPGRPRRLFGAVRDPDEEDHVALAAALAGALEPLSDGISRAEEAGRQWARRLLDEMPDPVAAGDAVERVVSLLDLRGFAPERLPEEIAMRRCPFRGVAEEHPLVVCGFHAGMIDGALEGAGSDVALAALDPWSRDGACVAHLSPRSSPLHEPEANHAHS